MPGPAPTPTALKVLRGNPGRRPLNESEPNPEVRIPDPPEDLTGRALEEWNRLAPELEKVGILGGEMDGTMLAGFCRLVERAWIAEAHIDAEGYIVKSAAGHPMQSPWVGMANRCWTEIRHFCNAYGMNPASRTKVSALPKGDGDEITEKLFGRKVAEAARAKASKRKGKRA